MRSASNVPRGFPSSIYCTGREESLWQQFWVDHGLVGSEVAYLKGLGEPSTLQALEDALSAPKLKVIGAVVDKVDRIMHGMELGAAGMHNQVRQWAAEGFLSALLDLLLSHGFVVFLTADHGNVECVGCGMPKEGMTADVRGERARIYSDAVLRANVAARFPAAISWKTLGLPEDFLPLLSADRSAFVQEGHRTVAHGGVTLEEAIVPFIRVVGGKD
ncbi:MAG: BREX-3 system phosphatase PglZ [Candidatus Solibacter sp.]|nr:BREX-3 system phosphatase PglZ [Candidatus Solibacter sp.]